MTSKIHKMTPKLKNHPKIGWKSTSQRWKRVSINRVRKLSVFVRFWSGEAIAQPFTTLIFLKEKHDFQRIAVLFSIVFRQPKNSKKTPTIEANMSEKRVENEALEQMPKIQRNWAQKDSKMALKWTQNGVKIVIKSSKSVKMAQSHPKLSKIEPKWHLKCPKMTSKVTKMTPKLIENGPTVLKWPQKYTKWHQNW